MGMFCTLASGSTGNCSIYRDDRVCILIDAGISLQQIRKAQRPLVSGVVIDAGFASSDRFRGQFCIPRTHFLLA